MDKDDIPEKKWQSYSIVMFTAALVLYTAGNSIITLFNL